MRGTLGTPFHTHLSSQYKDPKEAGHNAGHRLPLPPSWHSTQHCRKHSGDPSRYSSHSRSGWVGRTLGAKPSQYPQRNVLSPTPSFRMGKPSHREGKKHLEAAQHVAALRCMEVAGGLQGRTDCLDARLPCPHPRLMGQFSCWSAAEVSGLPHVPLSQLRRLSLQRWLARGPPCLGGLKAL